MFYSHDLLSIQRKGKLAQCWLAATVNEQMFKQMYKLSSMDKINLYEVCKEIIHTIQMKNNESNRRFSLYLSSQLMYGAVKILSYQTINLQNHIFQAYRKVLHHKRDKTSRIQNISTNLEACNVTSLIKDYTVIRSSGLPNLQDKFTINNKVQIMMHDLTCLDFGALTHEQTNFLPTNEEDPTSETLDRIYNANENLDKNLDDVRSNIEKVFTQFGTSISPMRDDALDVTDYEDRITFVKNTLPEITMGEIDSGRSNSSTPYKRKPGKSIHAELPVKKRRLKFEEEANKHQNINAPTREMKVSSTWSIGDSFEPLQDLESVDEYSPQIEKKSSKKRTFADENTRLNHRTIRKWLKNVKVHTTLLNVIDADMSTVEVLFKTPSTNCNPKHKTKWNNSLNTLFHIHTVSSPGKKAVQTKYDRSLEKSTEFPRFESKSNKNEESFSELSSGLGKSTISCKNITSEKNITIATDEFAEVLKVHDITDLITDAPITIQSPEISASAFVSETNFTSSKSLSSCLLTKREFFVLLEIAWQNTDLVAFNDVITPGHYNKSDAACCFTFLLEFHKEKRIILKQTSPYDIIWIQKYAEWQKLVTF